MEQSDGSAFKPSKRISPEYVRFSELARYRVSTGFSPAMQMEMDQVRTRAPLCRRRVNDKKSGPHPTSPERGFPSGSGPFPDRKKTKTKQKENDFKLRPAFPTVVSIESSRKWGDSETTTDALFPHIHHSRADLHKQTCPTGSVSYLLIEITEKILSPLKTHSYNFVSESLNKKKRIQNLR